ncbi:MAG: DUF4833 domain-containing protein [Saprospiraceae bacterium]|jgi:hypothetical protein|nr:DUF4833 domain-containing protein [Saprospiraceae bacterium]
MFFTQSEQYDSLVHGQEGRPADYPVIEPYPELLFFIQRNQNINTVIYELNHLPGEILNLNDPIKISWMYFDENRNTTVKELNYIQKKLAYGYHHRVISNELIEFRFVSYDQMTFYLAKENKKHFRVFSRFGSKTVEISFIYIYAEDLGVFPQVKFVEFFGKDSSTQLPFYEKLCLP